MNITRSRRFVAAKNRRMWSAIVHAFVIGGNRPVRPVYGHASYVVLVGMLPEWRRAVTPGKAGRPTRCLPTHAPLPERYWSASTACGLGG
jgi:hypothetical protein